MDQDLNEQLHEHYKFIVEKGHQLMRLDKFLIHRLANKSRNRIQHCIINGNVFCNKKQQQKNSYKVKPGDEISIKFEYEVYDKNVYPEDLPLDIMYDDKDIIIVNKAPGMVVHPSYGHYTGTLVNGLLFKYSDISKAGSSERPGLVHRIDKNTSGLLVVARNADALTHLGRQFFNIELRKRILECTGNKNVSPRSFRQCFRSLSKHWAILENIRGVVSKILMHQI